MTTLRKSIGALVLVSVIGGLFARTVVEYGPAQAACAWLIAIAATALLVGGLWLITE